MEVHLNPDLEAELNQLATETGRTKDDLVRDALTGYVEELKQVREMIDTRYDDLKSGRVKPIDGEEVFAQLRRKSQQRRAKG